MNVQWINLDCNIRCEMLFRLIFFWLLLLLAITRAKVCSWIVWLLFLYSIHITLAFWILFWKPFLRLHCNLYYVPNIEIETQPNEIASRSHFNRIAKIHFHSVFICEKLFGIKEAILSNSFRYCHFNVLHNSFHFQMLKMKLQLKYLSVTGYCEQKENEWEKSVSHNKKT